MIICPQKFWNDDVAHFSGFHTPKPTWTLVSAAVAALPSCITWLPLFLVLPPLVSVGATIDVYLLTGQSNSLGTTSLEGAAITDYGPGDHEADAVTPFYWSNVSSTNSLYPAVLYGDSGGAVSTMQMQQGDAGTNPTFWGPEIGFARQMFATGLTDLLVVKASRGGGGNALWDKSTFDANNNSGHMWGHVTDSLDVALTNIVNQGDSFSFKGIMYLQGESNNSGEASASDDRLADFITNLQSHVNATYANAASDMHTVVGEIAGSGTNANRTLTTQLQMDLAAADPDVTFVTTNDLQLKSDGIHFGRDAKLAIGNRFANAFIAVSEQPNGIPGDVNQDGFVLGDGTGPPEDDDVTAFLMGWQSNTTGLTNLSRTMAGDLNLDGTTSLPDAFILHSALETQGLVFDFAQLAAGVPEPAAAILVGFTLLGWPGSHRCRHDQRVR